tara:strand:+ start:7518 stop:8240 length:723 start_codon:yes stop_codon:yes gene_type:complete
MNYKTNISGFKDGEHIVRDRKLSELVKNSSFSDSIFLLISGREPDKKESVLFEKILVSVIDHGMGTTSSLSSRFVVSGGNDLNVGVGAGILSIGDYHGGAGEKAMKQFHSWKELSNVEEIVREKIKNREVIFGFGHREYKEGDPRVEVILDVMSEIGFESKFLKFKNIVEDSFKEIKGKNIPINIDGLIAILLCDFGFDSSLGKGVFIIGRTPGLVAQVQEEISTEKPVRRVRNDDIEYE